MFVSKEWKHGLLAAVFIICQNKNAKQETQKQGLVNVPAIGDWFHISFEYLLEMKYPQYLGDVKHNGTSIRAPEEEAEIWI